MPDSYITLAQATGTSGNKNIKTVHEMFILAIQMMRENERLMEVTKTLQGLSNRNKTESISNIEYKTTEARVTRDYKNDRRFPLETVTLKSQELSNKEKIDNAVIHTGYYADEFARSLHVLAFAVGKDIFFRNGAYKPETEEGRAILAHELKHVAQYNENPSEDNRTKKELEKEAAAVEIKEIHETDPLVSIEVERKTYKIRQSKITKLNYLADRELEDWVEQQEHAMPGEQYLKLLQRYKNYLENKA